MKRVVRSLAVLVAGGFLLAACSSSGTSSPSTSTPATKTTTTSVSSTTVCSIPQSNGGDGDADNNGAPSDGDGCDV
jgi:PBP1b-binding outer membrane lipoprotein LpoB